MKSIQSLLTELWDRSFNQEVIEKRLKLSVGDWDRGMLKQIDFLKTHKIKNENINHLFEESLFIPKTRHFRKDDQRFDWNSKISTTHSYWNRGITCWKDKNSFLTIEGKNYWLREDSKVLSEGKSNDFLFIRQIIFSKTESAYFFLTDTSLYRQDINRPKARPLLTIDRPLKQHTSLFYSKTKNLLFINCGDRIISFNPKTRKFEVVVKGSLHFEKKDLILNFIALTSGALRLIILSENGWLVLHHVGQRQKQAFKMWKDTEYLYWYHRNSFCDQEENQMGISQDERYLLMVKFGYGSNPTCFDLYEIQNDSLEIKQSIQVPGYEAKLYRYSSFFSSFSVGKKHLIFVKKLRRRISYLNGQKWVSDPLECFSVIDYNLRTGELRFIQPELHRVVSSSLME